jgi:acyl-coenzyme A thioesterase PaaI-like protein
MDQDRSSALAAVAAARGVNRALRVSTVDDATRDEVTALLDRARALLEAEVHEGPHCQVGFGPPDFGEGSAPEDFFPYSPVVGPLNPLSPPVELQILPDRSVRGTVTLHEGYNGPPWNLVHGGVIAAIFDEVLGIGSIAAAGGGFTGRLTITYRKPTPILQPLELSARLDRQEGRKLFMTGELRADGVLTAEAEGIFILTAGPLHDEPGAPAEAPRGGG